jgi:hypothetical protein
VESFQWHSASPRHLIEAARRNFQRRNRRRLPGRPETFPEPHLESKKVESFQWHSTSNWRLCRRTTRPCDAIRTDAVGLVDCRGDAATTEEGEGAACALRAVGGSGYGARHRRHRSAERLSFERRRGASF